MTNPLQSILGVNIDWCNQHCAWIGWNVRVWVCVSYCILLFLLSLLFSLSDQLLLNLLGDLIILAFTDVHAGRCVFSVPCVRGERFGRHGNINANDKMPAPFLQVRWLTWPMRNIQFLWEDLGLLSPHVLSQYPSALWSSDLTESELKVLPCTHLNSSCYFLRHSCHMLWRGFSLPRQKFCDHPL